MKDELVNKRIKLLHLTVTGRDLPPATVEFGEKLTVIHGASDTGKSHILDLITYSFGLAQSVDMPPEAKGYQYVLLGIVSEDLGTLTLVRDLSGGQIGVFTEDVKYQPEAPAPIYLLPNHTSKNPLSVSRYVLALFGLDENYVRRNQNNVTRMLELRDVFRLFAVGEEKILSKKSPIEFGQHADKPVESAVFRLFLEGKDDSGLVPIPKKVELEKIASNKTEILEKVIADLETKLEVGHDIDHLRDQLVKITKTLVGVTNAVETASAARDRLVQERSGVSIDLSELDARRNEMLTLIARFSLLDKQYNSDLSRLDLLSQASDSLGVVTGDRCPFCAALPQHQEWSHLEGNSGTEHTAFVDAVQSEMAKIQILRQDLAQTIDGLQQQEHEIRAKTAVQLTRLERIGAEIRESDRTLVSPGLDLAHILNVKSNVEKSILIHDQVAEITKLRADVSTVDKIKTSTEIIFSAKDLNQFDSTATKILTAWAFPHTGSVSYSKTERDLYVDRRPRKGRGKGVRSILHALFNVTLAEYCIQSSLPHPGVVILDSPIVTYRQPNDPVAVGEDETISTNVVDAFYSYLQNVFSGQSIILENKSPVSPLPAGSREYFFGGPNYQDGRRGFYPEHFVDASNTLL